MSFAASILILFPFLLSAHFCHSLTHISEKASYLAPETAEGYALRNNDDDLKSILVKNEQSLYRMGSKDDTDGNTEKHNQAELKYKSIRGWRKLVVVVSETNAKENAVASLGERKWKRSQDIDIDYAPPKTYPPNHN